MCLIETENRLIHAKTTVQKIAKVNRKLLCKCRLALIFSLCYTNEIGLQHRFCVLFKKVLRRLVENGNLIVYTEYDPVGEVKHLCKVETQCKGSETGRIFKNKLEHIRTNAWRQFFVQLYLS